MLLLLRLDQPVDTQGGASATIDDYFRWRIKYDK